MALAICTVCEVLDGDKTPKECTYCSRCKANICQPDLKRWDRRGRAMIALWGNPRGPVDGQKPQVATSGCGGCGKK